MSPSVKVLTIEQSLPLMMDSVYTLIMCMLKVNML